MNINSRFKVIQCIMNMRQISQHEKSNQKKDEIITTPIPPNTDIYTNGSLQYISQEEAKQIAFRKF